jgi:hypothetical protein
VPGHQGSAAAKVALAAVVFGLVLVVNGLTSLGARRIRGRDATMGLYHKQERLAPASIRVGTLLLALGLAGGVVLWILT